MEKEYYVMLIAGTMRYYIHTNHFAKWLEYRVDALEKGYTPSYNNLLMAEFAYNVGTQEIVKCRNLEAVVRGDFARPIMSITLA